MLSKPKIFLIILSLPILAYILFEVIYFNSTYPNIKLGTIDVGGKNKTELKSLLTSELQNRQKRTLSFQIDQAKPIAITLNENIIQYDVDQTVERLVSYGKKGPLTLQLQQKLKLFNTTTLEPVYTFDEFTFDTLLADALRPYESDVIETRIIYNNGELVLSPSKPGLQADRDRSIAGVKQYLALKSNQTIFPIQLQTIQPRTTRDNSRQVLELAQRAISKQLTLYSPEVPDQSWNLEAPDLYEFLEFTFDEKSQTPTIKIANYKVAKYSEQFAPLINKQPKEARFETAGNKVIVFEASQDGRTVDTEKLTQAISNSTFGQATATRIELPIKTLQPAVSQTAVNQYGIKDLLATGTSHFAGSSAGRLNNIEVATQKLNGTLIKPNENFSMYNIVGDIEKSTGFVDSAVIKNGRTVTGVGGGVCQVSTTLFRAALAAGLPITERSPHSYRVKYYELDSPPGLDAAIYFPGQDLQFRNNTGSHIILQAKLDKTNASLTFNLYGVNDGRTVTVNQPIVTNETPPPPEVRIESATVPKGIIRQTEFAAKGAQVKIDRVVTKDGQTILQDTITSNYRPWQAVYLIGTQEQ